MNTTASTCSHGADGLDAVRCTKCLVLAGGFAKRLYPLTECRAKALLEYRGEPALTHIANRIPLDVDIMVSTNCKFERDFIDWSATIDRPVELLVEEARTDEQKMGAISSIHYWIERKGLNEDLLLVAGDNYFEFELEDFIGKFDGEHMMVAVHDVGDPSILCEPGKPCHFGVAVLDGKKIARFDEKPSIPVSSMVSTGIYMLPSRIYPLLSQYCAESQRDNLGSFIVHLLDIGEEVDAYAFPETWVDIGDEIAHSLNVGRAGDGGMSPLVATASALGSLGGAA